MKKNRFVGALYVILASACYGVTPILTNAALKGGFPLGTAVRFFGDGAFAKAVSASPSRAIANETLIALMMFIACVFSLVNSIVGKKRIGVSAKQFLSLSFFGGGALCAALLLITYSYLYLPVGITIVLNFTYPVFVLLAGLILFRNKPDGAMYASLVLAISGIVFISSNRFSGSVELRGVLLALASGVAYAVYFLAGKHSNYAKLDSAVSNFYITGAAALISFIVAVALDRISIPTDAFMWILLIVEAALGYVVALRLLLAGIRILGAAPAAAINTLEPVFVLASSMLVFGETLTAPKLIGTVLVLTGALISILALKNAPSRKKSETKAPRA